MTQKYCYKSEDSRKRKLEACRKGGKIGGKITGAKNLTPYLKTEKFIEDCRTNGRKYGPKNIAAFLKTEKFIEMCKQNGEVYGARALIKYTKSDIGREKARKNGKLYGFKTIVAYMKSEVGREQARKQLARTKALIPTQSQQILNKALLDSGVYNKLEWYFPEIRRLGDIAIPSSKLIIEVDGSSHNGGMWCTKEEKQADDNLKDEQIKSLGWNVIRFKNEEIENDVNKVIEKIKEETKHEF